MTIEEKRKAIQGLLGVKQDGIRGPITSGAWDDLWHPGVSGASGLASSFADPADIAAFKRCKAQGKTDQECFKVGDNGIGKWGDDTTVAEPLCALPREDWAHLTWPAKARVRVTVNGKSITCRLADTMPAKANIKNGAVIDLNAHAWKLLGFTPPVLKPCTWSWVP